MASRQLDEERIFHVARDIATRDSRDEYLDQICAGDRDFRKRIEALLEVHEKAESFLKSADCPVTETIEFGNAIERPGASIGRYKLMEQIGEGGMGTVFVAQQHRPIRCNVARKVIKPGMDTKEAIAGVAHWKARLENQETLVRKDETIPRFLGLN